jgi:hypothetical protein
VPYSATAGGNSLVATRGHQILAIFSVVTLLTVIIVCANVANLLIARAAARERETALRRSLGASRTRIVRTLLAEGLLLSLAAWLTACLFAWHVSRLVPRFVRPPANSPMMMPDLAPDWTVVAYALGLAFVCTMAVTLSPALRAWRQPLLPFLKVGEAGVVQGRSRLSRTLVVLQLAFSVLLLTSAGLAYRSLSTAFGEDVGFDTRGILLITVSTTGTATEARAHRVELDGLQAAIARLPGVERVSYLAGSRIRGYTGLPVEADARAAQVLAVENRVAPGFFAAMGVPMLEGRDFNRDDALVGSATAVVTHDLAQTLWPGMFAVGKTLLVDVEPRAREVTVIGVVRDAFFAGRATGTPPRYIFLPEAHILSPTGQTTFVVRYGGRADMLGPGHHASAARGRPAGPRGAAAIARRRNRRRGDAGVGADGAADGVVGNGTFSLRRGGGGSQFSARAGGIDKAAKIAEPRMSSRPTEGPSRGVSARRPFE